MARGRSWRQMLQGQRIVPDGMRIGGLFVSPQVGPRERHAEGHFSAAGQDLGVRIGGVVADGGFGEQIGGIVVAGD